jgi:uncharacterized protein YqfA (UPF0365 family)
LLESISLFISLGRAIFRARLRLSSAGELITSAILAPGVHECAEFLRILSDRLEFGSALSTWRSVETCGYSLSVMAFTRLRTHFTARDSSEGSRLARQTFSQVDLGDISVRSSRDEKIGVDSLVMESLYLVGVAVLALFALVLAIILFNFFGLWIRARIANAPVGLGKMVGMRLRKVPVGFIVDNRITAVKAGLPIASDPLEAHYLAGGSVDQVVLALIAADKAGISLDFNRACAIDLATKGTGKTVLEAVRTSINPKVIDAPSPNMGRATIDGVAQDGIGVKVKARVTVRSHLDRFVGGATEETIIARVGEGIVSAIGSAHSYKEVLENPDRISKTVLAKGLDSNTAFEILSIDIADVDVGDNIGAKLQTEQADADKRVAQAKAEVRRAAAVAVEQEMRAKTQEMRAKVVEAEALVPQAMADAFRSGNLGVMDYVRMKNVQADTSMRESIAGTEKPRTEGT